MFMRVLRRVSHAKETGHRLSRQYVHVRLIVCVCLDPLLSLLPLVHACAQTHMIVNHNFSRSLQKALKAFESNPKGCSGGSSPHRCLKSDQMCQESKQKRKKKVKT